MYPEHKKELRERLSALEHEQWAHWTKYMLSQLQKELRELSEQFPAVFPNGHPLLVDLPSVKRWLMQIDTPYEDLSEKEKDSDREWADKVFEAAKVLESEVHQKNELRADGWCRKNRAR